MERREFAGADYVGRAVQVGLIMGYYKLFSVGLAGIVGEEYRRPKGGAPRVCTWLFPFAGDRRAAARAMNAARAELFDLGIPTYRAVYARGALKAL